MAADLIDAPFHDPTKTIRLVPSTAGVTVLGTPIGPDHFVSERCLSISSKIGSKMELLDKVRELKHESLLLLRLSFNPRFQHLLRTVPPDILRLAAVAHDNRINNRLSRLLPTINSMPLATAPSTWPLALKRARLPLRLGGLGIPAATFHSQAAFTASIGLSWPALDEVQGPLQPYVIAGLRHFAHHTQLVDDPSPFYPSGIADTHAQRRCNMFQTIVGVDVTSVTSDSNSWFTDNEAVIMGNLYKRFSQGRLARITSSHEYDLIMRDVATQLDPLRSPYFLSRFLSGSCREATMWTAVIPSQPLFAISPNKFDLLLSYQLGLPFPQQQRYPSNCECTVSLQRDPLHIIGCERRYPHDRVKLQLAKFCQAAGLVPTVEPLNTCTGPCQPDIAIPDLHPDGKTILLDITTADPGAVTHLNRESSKKYFVAAEAVEAAKRTKYSGNFNPDLYEFTAIALETPGRWSRDFARFFNKIKRFAQLNRVQGSVRHSLFIQHWRRQLCLTFRLSQAISAESLSSSLISGSS